MKTFFQRTADWIADNADGIAITLILLSTVFSFACLVIVGRSQFV